MGLADRMIVSNTTPLINLAGVGLLDLLPALYGTITIPDAVWHEYRAGMKPNDPNLEALAWLKIESGVVRDPSLPGRLGAGEAEVISLALDRSVDTILLDEAYGRQIAKRLGLPVSGTLGTLIGAKRQGLIPKVQPMIDALIAQGRWISPQLREHVLQVAGESP